MAWLKKGVRGSSRHKGQISIEYLLVVGFATLMILPIVIIFFRQTTDLSDSLAFSQAQKIVKKLGDTAESVYYQGYPSQDVLTIYFPEKINAVTIATNEIIFEMKTDAGYSDIFAVTSVNLTGSIGPESGVKKIKVKATGTVVNITEET